MKAKHNQSHMAKVGNEELLRTLQIFQKDNIPSPDGLPTELFLKCFDFIGHNLKRVLEHSRTSDKTLAAFNTTFIALIPKANNPTCYESIRPISLCNSIYKIISIIVSWRLKDILSYQTSPEQIGFLKGKQIHEFDRVA